MLKTIFVYILAMAAAGTAQLVISQEADQPMKYSNIKDDEVLVFFPTSAWLDVENKLWNIPIHGWIYEPENSTVRKSLIARVLKEKYALEADSRTQNNLDRRINLLISDNERGKEIVIRIGGKTFSLPPSEPNGQFREILQIPVQDLAEIQVDNTVVFSAIVRKNDARVFQGKFFLIPPEGLSIISDIDDTVKVTQVTDRKRLFDYTLFQDFEPVPGMANLYQRWAKENVSVHYVSSSPWQLYPLLSEFMETHRFPWTTFSLKAVRFRDHTLFDLFKKGTETKPPQIEAILRSYPKRKFLLVGDSGEQDPEVYAQILRDFPTQILKMYIRNVTAEAPDGTRFSAAFKGIDANRWQLFDEPETLELPPEANRFFQLKQAPSH